MRLQPDISEMRATEAAAPSFESARSDTRPCALARCYKSGEMSITAPRRSPRSVSTLILIFVEIWLGHGLRAWARDDRLERPALVSRFWRSAWALLEEYRALFIPLPSQPAARFRRVEQRHHGFPHRVPGLIGHRAREQVWAA
jgi:hypothetical protein